MKDDQLKTSFGMRIVESDAMSKDAIMLIDPLIQAHVELVNVVSHYNPEMPNTLNVSGVIKVTIRRPG